MSEFAELGKVLDRLTTKSSQTRVEVYFFSGRWHVTAVQQQRHILAKKTAPSLDTALTLVLQDLRDMANE